MIPLDIVVTAGVAVLSGSCSSAGEIPIGVISGSCSSVFLQFVEVNVLVCGNLI